MDRNGLGDTVVSLSFNEHDEHATLLGATYTRRRVMFIEKRLTPVSPQPFLFNFADYKIQNGDRLLPIHMI